MEQEKCFLHEQVQVCLVKGGAFLARCSGLYSLLKKIPLSFY